MFNVGDQVTYLINGKKCIVIATRDQPHKYRFGVADMDNLGLIRQVPDGFAFTLVELGLDFSPYIDVTADEIRR